MARFDLKSAYRLLQSDDLNFPDNFNSLVEVTLLEDEPYGIVVSAFGVGGDYRLSMR